MKQWMHFIDNLVKNRCVGMGIAMLLVVLYHLFCADKTIWLWKIFYPGYLGVDFFLFLSGYGLCFSMQQHSISEFYKRRIKRIYPLYVIMALIISALYAIDNNITIVDLVCNITTLSYWGIGGQFIDWYLSFLIVLYLAFPLLYNFIFKTNDWLFLGGLLIVVLIAETVLDLSWKYNCALSRLPIFVLGIMYYKDKNTSLKCGIMLYTVAFVVAALLYLQHRLHTYVVIYMLAPYGLIAVGYSIAWIRKHGKVKNSVELIGKYTLEIYVANIVTLALVPMCKGYVSNSIFYILSNVVLAFSLISVNRVFNRRL